ncbi:glycosyltransferase [Deinococcus sp.]|uniref:glycosyltransferase n=1 Tax=Deinococcus sp. TaxID=47478 RepID=UPI0025D3DB7E|nr:glycosyltransferase [Deinococcus sp.]
MKPLRIGLFTDTFLPDQNGITTSVGLLASELSARGHCVDIIAPDFPGYREVRPGVVRVPSLSYLYLPTYRLAWPGRRDFATKYDLIHTHTPLTLGMAATRLARKWGVPQVATYHTHIEAYTHYLPGMTTLQRRTRVITRVAGLHYRRAQAVITPTVGMLDVLREMRVAWPVVIPTSIDPQSLEAGAATHNPWPAGQRRVLSVGRLAREKRFDLVLDALARLPDAALLLLGEGPERSHLEAHARAIGVAERVQFLGVKPWEEMGGYYRWAELFLFASDTETQGLVLQEAQLMGVPVVAVGARGTLSGVQSGSSGYLVAPGDVGGLVAASRKLLDSAARHTAFAAQGRQFARQWTPGMVTERTLEVYARVLGYEVPGHGMLGQMPRTLTPGRESSFVYDR